MEVVNIKTKFNTSVETYDSQRRFFIPCFDDYYQTGIKLLAYMRKEFNSVLDLGAGTGLLSRYLYETYPTANYTLVDIAEKMLDIAKLRFEGLSNFSYCEADYSKELPQGEFDLVSSALSIHHLDEQEKFSLYTSIYNKLPSGGCLLNVDQFNAGSEEMNKQINHLWYTQISTSGISDEQQNLWLQRRELDKENTISETLAMLKEIGFSHVESVYQYLKFGVVLAIK